MQKTHIYFYKIGEFSQINKAIARELAKRFPDCEFRIVDIEKDIIARANSWLRLRAFVEALLNYGFRILFHKIPPRDFFPRLPCILRTIQKWVSKNMPPEQTAFSFQTQSLFDARRTGIPHFVYTDHTYLANFRYEHPKPPLPVSKQWRQMEKALYEKATLNFTLSQFATDSLSKDYNIPPAQIQCVYSGSNIGFPAIPNTHHRTGRKILFVAVEWERKGGPDLIEAFSLVQKEVPDAELLIVGCHPPVHSSAITVTGRLPLEKVKSYYEAADIFCLPSRIDPSASVLAEASAYALPIVATAVGGNKERVVEGKTGFLVPPGDIPALAKHLCYLLKDSELRNKMGNQGREHTMDLFHWPRVADRIAHAVKEKIYAARPPSI